MVLIRKVQTVVALALLLVSTWASASNEVLNDLNVVETQDGTVVEIRYFRPLFYVSHSPEKSGRKLTVQLRQNSIDLAAAAEFGNNEEMLMWSSAFGAPVDTVSLEDIHSETPTLIVRFAKKVRFSARHASDHQSMIIVIERDKSEVVNEQVFEERTELSVNLVTKLKPLDFAMSDLLDRANKAMLDGDYSRAVQIFTRIRAEGNDAIKPPVQELIGLAREYKGQTAHAKAEYERYLEDYPNGQAASRVQQRLNAIVTASHLPKGPIAGGESTEKQGGWNKQVYGSFGQYYFRNEIQVADQSSRLLRSVLSNDLNMVARMRNEQYDFKAQVSGNYQKDLNSDTDRDRFNPNTLSIEGRQKDWGLYGRLGRQSRNSGGVFGRFDGGHFAYEATGVITVNGVFGYPVDFSKRDEVNVDKAFYGASIDIGTLWDGWEFSGFYFSQENQGLLDREAIGGEVRYFDGEKSLFTLVDYDIYYEELNLFIVNGTWAINDGLTVNGSYDRRNSPMLTTGSAVVGQRGDELVDLATRYTLPEILRLALDRTATLDTLTLGLSQRLNDNWQFNFSMNASDYGGTLASGGVEAIDAYGQDFYYSAQLVSNRFISDSDSLILGARYADTDRAQTSTLDINWRIAATDKLRLNPRLRFDYRTDNSSDNSRVVTRPALRLDYAVRRRIKLEIDLGYDLINETFAEQEVESTGYYINAGYRVQF
ncbi:MAG TPA: hypothetical protein VIC26_07860 [Marinagarivorans sp.]